ncbi:girdin-like [Gouania willdenowi]|uniref:girdin-like n=1 Tax=Gouania willdenowi TaxID=441366 RepID=UPI001054A3FF|nr:girdin-like [Gouania willdenowi]
MESRVFLSSLDHFMLSPLVSWVKTFVPCDGGIHLDFSELLDGVFLNDIMSQINPASAALCVNKVSRDPSQKIHNLNLVVQQIKAYYLDNLRQLIMFPLPNVMLLGRMPYCEQSLEEMKKLLLLLLGCAVQCERKEEYIERIQMLDFDTKAAIAAQIQELTHNQENVLDLHWLEATELHPEEMEALSRSMASHLRHLLDQRDAHLETIAELMHEKEGAVGHQQQVGTQQHLAVELADSKAKIRRLRQELEEKSEQILDCRHELENLATVSKRIQQENSQLLVDARAARTYRDELDALRERAIKADKLESELGRCKEQLHKMEFYKAKVEELKEDVRVLQETKEVLEDQLEGWRSRSDKVHQLEKHSLLLKAQVHELEQEREVDRKHMDDLQKENLALCMAQRRTMEESQHLGWELEQLSKTSDKSQGQQTLSEEVVERTRSRMLKLEKENKSLLRTIEYLRTASNTRSAQTRQSQQLSCNTNDVSSNEERPGLENHSHVSPNDSVTQHLLNGDLNCQLDSEGLGVVATNNFHIQEKGQREDENSRQVLKESLSDREVLENSHNKLYSVVDSHDQSPSSGYGSIFMGGPTRTSKHTQQLEAKCKALDTANQHLQTSLDNTDRKVQRLEAEVQDLEAENHSLQATLEGLRISVRRLEQLETEKQSLEQETAALDRDKRQLEKENRRLKQQAEIQDANLNNSNVCMAGLEREMRFLSKELETLREMSERVRGLERDNRGLSKQAAIDQKTLSTLREELVSEKLNSQQRQNELERLTHELDMKGLNQEGQQSAEAETPNDRFRMLESELESSLKKSLQIKDDKMASLEARLQESSSLNQQLRQELRTVKLSCEALHQRLEEEQTILSNNSTGETGMAVNEWLRESQEATKELLRLKDHLIGVERNNATLEAERQALHVQLKQLESHRDVQQAQILSLQRQAATLQENNTSLQTHNANLQVEKSTLSSQSAALMAQNKQLQQQQSKTESNHDNVVRERENLRGVHEQLLRDHERLEILHERQSMECETLMGKHGCLKKAHRTLELEHRTLQDRHNSLLKKQTKLDEHEKALKEEQMRMVLEREQHRTTAAECCRLRDEKDWLNQTYRQLLNDNESLTVEHKQLKSQLNEAKLENTWLQADFSKLKKEFQQLDITSTKLTNQCELLSQVKSNLEEESRHLLTQIETLMMQNRALLEQSMESKDFYHVEERQYIDKLNDLRRQKEKLEEKIMDQYKFYEPSPPRRRGNWITLKLKKLIKSSIREPGGPEPPPTSADAAHLSCHDSTSILSSEGSAADALSPRRCNTPRKIFPCTRKRLKDRNRVKSLFRRSLSLSSLSFPPASFEACGLAESSEQLDGSNVDLEKSRNDPLTSSPTTTSILSMLHRHHDTIQPSGHPNSTTDTVSDLSELLVTGKDGNHSAVPSGCDNEQQNLGLNASQSRAQSESSGEFSLSLENEPWSNRSSPVQPPPSRSSSLSNHLPSEASSSPQHNPKDKANSIPAANTHKSDARDVLPHDLWLTRNTKSIRKGSRRGKVTHQSSDSGTIGKNHNMDSNLSVSQAEATRASACSPITVLYVQGKSSSMSGCLNCFSTPLGKEGKGKGTKGPKGLPRASSVISTAEGSSRRSSISSVSSSSRVVPNADPLSGRDLKDCNNQTEADDPNPQSNREATKNEPIPPTKPPRDPSAVVLTNTTTTAPVQEESLFESLFTFNSVFSNTIFSDSVVTAVTNLDVFDTNQTLICPNISVAKRREPAEEPPQTVTEEKNELRANVG